MPCLLFDGSALVKTIQFRNARYVGDPINAIKIFNEKEVDELILLDINASRTKREPRFDLIRECASECFMPFTYGGGVTTVEQFGRLYKLGVEKVVVNTLCLTRPDVVRDAVRQYGSTSVVGAVDYERTFFGGKRIYSAVGARTRRSPVEHCKFLSDDLGVGEILLNSVERDGTWTGFDLDMIREVGEAVTVPLIACGGAGNVSHIKEVLASTPANAAAIGSMAVFQRQGMGVLINFPARNLILDDD
jgi:cyclase